MLRWYALSYHVKEVLAVKEMMSERGIPPTSHTFHHLFRVLDRYYPRMVERFYAEMRGRGVGIATASFPILLRVFRELGNEAVVEELLVELRAREASGDPAVTSPAIAKELHRALPSPPIDGKAGEGEGEEGEKRPSTPSSSSASSSISFYEEAARELREAVARRDRPAFEGTLARLRKRAIRPRGTLLGVILRGWGVFKNPDGVAAALADGENEGGGRRAALLADAAAAFARMRAVAEVDRCWQELLESCGAIPMAVYNRFLDLYLSLNQIPKVQGILDTMMKRMPPNILTATTVVDLLGRMGRFDEMEEVFAEMAKSPHTTPNLTTYHRAMAAYARGGDVAKLEAFRERMLREGFVENSTTFNLLFEGYGRAKRYAQLQELWKERQAKGIAMEENGFVLLFHIYARARMPEETMLLATAMEESGIALSSRLLATVASAFGAVGNMEEMSKYVARLRALPRPRLRDIESIYNLFARIRDVVRLQELLDSETLPKSELIYNISVSAFARAGERTKVAHLLTEMEQKGYKLSRSSNMILSSLLLKSGRGDIAQAMLQGDYEDSAEDGGGEKTSWGLTPPDSSLETAGEEDSGLLERIEHDPPPPPLPEEDKENTLASEEGEE
ncbi:unnamed protein product [Phytomonas sp. EM1]|nr:unnamed protein product [Phytomonas sp. EM1]|eukprot:CCW62137.1 unnamed protein product [Phytomonas sp. isolate EM1]